jgi:hypothetical protein
MTPKNSKKTTRVSKIVAELTGKEISFHKKKKKTPSMKHIETKGELVPQFTYL